MPKEQMCYYIIQRSFRSFFHFEEETLILLSLCLITLQLVEALLQTSDVENITIQLSKYIYERHLSHF